MEPFETKEKIGEKIRRKREGLGKTQEEFAKLVRVHKQQICRYEKGHARPRDKTLQKIFGYGEPIQDSLNISEQNDPYRAQTAEQKLLDNVKEILESGNKERIIVLKANIKDSLSAVRSNKKDEDKKEI